MRITPDCKSHARLERDVREWCEDCGFFFIRSGYESVILDKRIRNRLSHIDTPTALYVRARHDCIAIHKEIDFVFLVEIKTHSGSDYHNVTIEALPFVHHYKSSTLGVECLYVYRDEDRDFEGGFLANEDPGFSRLVIPQRFSSLQKFIKREFPEVDVTTTAGTRGSNDPFFIVPEKTARREFLNWKDWIQQNSEI